MLFAKSWLSRWLNEARGHRPERRWTVLLSVERLEDRCLLAAPPFITPPLMVTTVSDNGNDASPLVGSLRKAILDANRTPGLNTILFNITDPKIDPRAVKITIKIKALPQIIDPVIIDAATQPAGRARQNIILQGDFGGTKTIANGLTFAAGSAGSKVFGLTIQDFSGDGILLDKVGECWIGGTAANQADTIIRNELNGIEIKGDGATENHVIADFIGTNSLSGTGLGNKRDGVLIGPGAFNNYIGGSTEKERNVISANGRNGIKIWLSSNNVIAGNYIGTTVDGKSTVVVAGDVHRLGNEGNGIFVGGTTAANNSIGGLVMVVRGELVRPSNFISGNKGSGISIFRTSSTFVFGNFIGVDKTGKKGLGNGRDGISILNGSSITIGGAFAQDRNIISANGAKDTAFSGISVDLKAKVVKIENNYIGTKNDGTGVLGNKGWGIIFGAEVTDSEEKRNLMKNNGSGNDTRDVSGKNKIWKPKIPIGGAGLSIDIGPLGVTTAGMPVLTSAVVSGNTTVVAGSLTGIPNSSFTLEFFGNQTAGPSGYGPAEQFLGDTTVTTNASGNATYSVTLNAVYGLYVTATSTGTSQDGNTSEFAQDIAITGGSSTLPPAPTVTALDVTSGPTSGGTTVQITGTNFQTITEVDVGGAPADFTRSSTTSLTITIPAEGSGTVDVMVVTPSGTSAFSTADRYTFVAVPAPDVTALSASTGTTPGGTLVTITGHRFTGTQTIFFGSVPAASFVVLNDTQIVAVAPAQFAGAFDVTVLTPTGTSAVSAADLFTYTAAAAPTVSALAISTGTTAGGAVVTITGTGLASTTGVSFGSVAALGFTVLSDTTLVATAPPQAAGTVDVTVTTFSATSATSSADHFVVTAASAPAVTAVSPGTGSALGGDAVTLSGSGFLGATGISFGTASASFSILSDTAILAYAPAALAGTVDVTVTTFAGTSSTSSADQFTYSAASAPAVSALSTSSGSTKGGAQVVLTGSGFSTVSAVNFGDVAVYGFVVNSDTQLTVLSPAQFAGTVDVTVANGAGTSAAVAADRFSYTAASAPVVTSLSVSSGGTGGGTSVTIAGTDLLDAFAVKFGDVYADFVVNSDTSITATAPSQAAGTVDVTVTTFAGSSASVSADHFTFNSAGAPTVTALATAAGTSAGGTLVTLTGTALLGTTAVSFGGVSASFVVESDTSISAVAPPQAAGTFHVTVTTPTGTSSTSSADQFVYSAASAPAVTLVTSNAGSTPGGGAVTVLGSGFTGASSVLFGTVAASSFTVNSDGSIAAIAPPQAAGTVDVTVTTFSATSATSSADHFVVTAASAPAVTAVSPGTGSALGGDAVTISGSGFLGATGISFGTTPADFSILSDTAILAYAPAGLAGTVDVTVTTFAGTSSTSSADQFTYSAASAPTVSALSTSSGSTKGGAQVVLTGSGFSTASAVNFGDVAVYDFVVNSDTQLTVLSPAQFAGSVDVTVANGAGTSAAVAADRFSYTAASAPAVTSLSASSGGTGGGTSVTIAGTDLLDAFAVKFGDVYADFVVNSDTSITATAPSQAAGTVDVTVTTFAGSSASVSADHFTFNSAGAPTVTALATAAGTSAGGTLVTLTGTALLGTTAVSFGGVSASFVVNSDTSIGAVAPPQAAGTFHVTVTTPTGTSSTSSADQFVYSAAAAPAVTLVTSNAGSTPGGGAVTIVGSGFTGASSILFGTVAASSFTVNADGSITAIAPPQAAGTVDVRVVTPSGTSPTGMADHFTVSNVTAPSPAVTGLDATTGSTAGGRTVTITGTNFSGATSVSFGGTAATFTVVSDTTITATAPARAAGLIDVTVTTNNGTSATGSADQFTFLSAAAPTVTSLGTATGNTEGGTSVAIVGTGFTGSTSVTFGGVVASFTVNSSTSITATSPAQGAGTVDVVVTTPSGPSALTSSDHFAYTNAALPAVTTLSATTGPSGGGTAVTIAGTDFLGAFAVTFGDVPAASFTVVSATSITATAPPDVVGPTDVRVSTFSGRSATSSTTRFTFTAASTASVSSLSYGTGGTAGGTAVTIAGTGFSGASRVRFGSVDAAFIVESDTWVLPPAQGPAGAGLPTIRATGETLFRQNRGTMSSFPGRGRYDSNIPSGHTSPNERTKYRDRWKRQQKPKFQTSTKYKCCAHEGRNAHHRHSRDFAEVAVAPLRPPAGKTAPRRGRGTCQD